MTVPTSMRAAVLFGPHTWNFKQTVADLLACGGAIEVPDASTFLVRLTRELSTPMQSLTMRRPSLDDVFLNLTGHAIRDEAAGSLDQFRNMAQIWGGRRR